MSEVVGNDTRRYPSARLPATLLLLAVAATAAAVVALILTPPPGPATVPMAKIGLQGAAKPATEPSPATPPSSKRTPPDAESPDRKPAGTAGAKPDAEMPKQQAVPPTGSVTAAARESPKEPSRTAAEAPPIFPVDKSPPAARPQPGVIPPLTQEFPDLPKPPVSDPLPRTPDPALVEETSQGPLPIVGRDGREPWVVYARPFDGGDRRPRVAVVLYGLGASASATKAAIHGLPGAITLAFSPYSDRLPSWMTSARAAGHETLLMVPMEPVNYPQFDPGPQALLTTLETSENISRFNWMLGRATGYVGVMNYMGDRFTQSQSHMTTIFQEMRRRGLLYLESRPQAAKQIGEIARTVRLPLAVNTLYLDRKASRSAIDDQLAETVRLARKLGRAVVLGYPYPVTLERIARWCATLEKEGIALAPVSAIAERR